MTTFGQMIDETLSHLRGFVRDQELSTHLVSGCTSSDVSLSVADGSVVSRGRVEIGSELIYVDRSDRTTGLVSVPPYGRGMDGTSAVSHSSGARVVVAPLFPRSWVGSTLNQFIESVDLWGVGVDTFTFTGSVVTYELPAEVDEVLAVSFETPGPSGMWLSARRWRFDRQADATAYPSGRSLDLYDCPRPGSTVKVVYRVTPARMTAEADVFTTVTGLPESTRDVYVLGAASRLLALSEGWESSTRAVEASAFAANRQQSSGSQALASSKYLYGLHRARLDEERASLLGNYPGQVHYIR